MAEIVLPGLIQVTLERLSSVILKESRLFWGYHNDIETLRNTLSIILGVLTDAEEKQQTDNGVKIWLKHLEGAAYDADDILDKCETEALRRKLETEGLVTSKIRRFFSAFNEVLFHYHVSRKIKDIRERLDVIAVERLKYGLKPRKRAMEVKGREETDSNVRESDVKGREEDREKIVERLLNAGNEEKVWIISVTGMGGIGKTTLAQLVHNDARVKEHFHLRLWVCVSDYFDMTKLTKKIIESADQSKCDLDNVELLQGRLREKLSGRKFLLVLDDVWNKKPFDWERLKSFLQEGSMGSKILVTTRSEEDALIMGTHDIYHLSRLAEDDCWYLFHQRAFGRGQEEYPKLVDIGKEILKKCGGVPLAVKALGGLMHTKRGESEWKAVKESEIWNSITEKHDSILPALRLSYNDLPSYLKPCFAYCSIFPKDHPIEVKELIRFWMAEGFIQSSQGSRTMEDIGREYFKNLLWRSFFEDPETDDGGYVVRCKMHDLIHDLALSVFEDARSILSKNGNITIPDRCRRLSVKIRGQDSITLMTSNKSKKLRTLLVLPSRFHMRLDNISCHLPCLRILDLRYMNVMEETLDSISKLKQLRYLCLALQGIETLPNSFSGLHNLQTLELIKSWCLVELPRDMRKMISLRHLEIRDWESLTCMPTKMGQLTLLQTLPVFILGKESGCNIGELQDLNQLGGELNIRKLENVRRGNGREATLNEKENLRILTFSWSNNIIISRDCSEQTLEDLQPHPNLKSLRIENYGGNRLPHWISNPCLPNLVELFLINCRGWDQELLPPLGRLQSLKFLQVGGMDGVKCIGSQFYGDHAFPLLEHLILEGMPNLEDWSVSNTRQVVVLPHLKHLEMRGCPRLTAKMPCFPLLSSLKVFDFQGESLRICFFHNQLIHLSKLEELHIDNCPNLLSLFPEAMQNHTILTSLKSFYIRSCEKLICLPEVLKNATTLQRLQIWNLRNLETLPVWFGNLSSLRSVVISNCPTLVSFPSEFQHLTNLQDLSIWGCPQLEKRCRDGTGEDWHKIAHIPCKIGLSQW